VFFIQNLNRCPTFRSLEIRKEYEHFSYDKIRKGRSKPVSYHCDIRLAVPWNITSNYYCNNEAPAKFQVKCHYGPHKSGPALLRHFCITHHC